MDACYSGLAIQRSASPGERRFVSDMLQRRSRQVITAGKANETVADGGGPDGTNSIFTGQLLDGLRGAAASDGVMTASDLMNYAYRKVARDAASRQTPHFGHVDGDGEFILLVPGELRVNADERPDFLVKTVAEQPEAPALFNGMFLTPPSPKKTNTQIQTAPHSEITNGQTNSVNTTWSTGNKKFAVRLAG